MALSCTRRGSDQISGLVFFTERVVRHGDKFSRDMVDSLSLGSVQEAPGCGMW